MTRTHWGTIYLVSPDWHGDREHADESVVVAYRHGPSHMKIASELWQLAGRDDRAGGIDNLISQVNDRDDPVMDTDEIRAFLRLLDGLEDALKTTVIGADWMVPAERMQEVRSRSKLLDLDEERGEDARAGVWEGVTRVSALRNILTEALERGLHIALD